MQCVLRGPDGAYELDGASGRQAESSTFQWTGSPGATSYQLDVLQPPLGSINTNSAATGFTASGVPNGVYRVQVRGVNPAGASAPSNVVDVVVGAAAPCASPTAPATVNASLTQRHGNSDMVWSGRRDELSRACRVDARWL